jgi:tetratricopeptide (TPR) repeat protein
MVVILDHAQSAAQVAPLLTGAPGVFTIVVARRPFPDGLDAAPVPVGPLSDRDATVLLTALAGRQAVTAARRRLPAVLTRCAGSPYALHAAARSLLATGTAPESGPAAAPDPADPGTPGTVPPPQGAAMPHDPVSAAAEDAYARLPGDAARCYRLWALRPWSPLRPELAAAVADVPQDEAVRLLAVLAACGLLDGPGGAGDGDRGDPAGTGPADGYRYRDAVRAHAEAAAFREDGLAACTRAVRRGVEHVVRAAVAADAAALPHRWHVSRRYDDAGQDRCPDEGAALAALVAELPNVVEAARAAADFEDADTVAVLAEASWSAQLKAGRHDEVLPLLRLAARTAHEHGLAPRAAGRVHAQLGLALTELGDHTAAESAFRDAAEADRAAGHLRGQATAVESLGLLRLRQWRWQEAADCFAQADAVWDGVGPGDDGFADLPRARALLQRHTGRALRGLGDLTASLARSHTALASFRALGDTYNAARTLTDLAETRLEAGAPQDALPLIDEALALLPAEAAPHVRYLRSLRAQVTSGE